jgi:hypothetical protein
LAALAELRLAGATAASVVSVKLCKLG